MDSKQEKLESNSENSLIQCPNCQQNILSANMFLHEGFCLRNNTFCSKCKKVILKKDYETHIKNNCEQIKEEPKTEKKEHNLVIKDITEEEEQKQKKPITINQINYNSCVNMNFPPVIKTKEIIKINDPIIVSINGDNPSNNTENYQDYFSQKFGLSNYLNSLYTKNTYSVQKLENIDSRKNSAPNGGNNELSYYSCKKITVKNENAPKNSKDKNILNKNYVSKKSCDYSFNNSVFRSSMPPITQKETDDLKNNSDDSSNKKEPLDSSRFIKNLKKQQQSNTTTKIPKIEKVEQQKTEKKYEKCEYCNRVTKDMNAHIYNCEARRLFEIERIQTKQDEDEQKRGRKLSIIMKSSTSLYNIPNSVKRERLNSDFDGAYLKNKLKEKVDKIMLTQDRRNNRSHIARFYSSKGKNVSLKTLKMKFPVDRKENGDYFKICI